MVDRPSEDLCTFQIPFPSTNFNLPAWNPLQVECLLKSSRASRARRGRGGGQTGDTRHRSQSLCPDQINSNPLKLSIENSFRASGDITLPTHEWDKQITGQVLLNDTPAANFIPCSQSRDVVGEPQGEIREYVHSSWGLTHHGKLISALYGGWEQ